MDPKETNQIGEVKDMSLTVNKPYIAYVFKKTQKIVHAIYLLTEYFDPAESIRASIRINANALLNTATALLKSDQKDKRQVSHLLTATFLETLAFTETARLVRMLSDSNYSILKEEIERVIEMLDVNVEKGIILSREFMETRTLEEYKRQADSYKGHDDVLYVKDIFSKREPGVITVTPQPQGPAQPSPASAAPLVNRSSTLNKSDKMPKVVQQENKSKRLDKMLSLFKPNTELMIKDITTHLKDVSEKTIQRELLSLVEQGKLKKIGKKRWSKYRLA